MCPEISNFFIIQSHLASLFIYASAMPVGNVQIFLQFSLNDNCSEQCSLHKHKKQYGANVLKVCFL